MAEVDKEKTLTLAQQYSLKEKEEASNQGVIPVEAVADVSPTTAAAAEDVVNVSPANAVQEVIGSAATAVQEVVGSAATAVEAVVESVTTPTEEVVVEKTDETVAAVESSEAPEAEKSEVEELVDQISEIKLETAPVDFRFPTTNQTRHCFTRYVEYHRCVAAKGDDAPECDKFAKYYRALCPGEWVDRWNEQRENGTFPGPL